jgi:hypothetical protein
MIYRGYYQIRIAWGGENMVPYSSLEHLWKEQNV